jgi:hypothetical protein
MGPRHFRTAATVVALLAGLTLGGHATAAPAGKLVSVKDSPGYVPLQDPDSLAEKLGRRPSAKLVSMPFQGGTRTLNELALGVLRALHHGAADSLLAMCVEQEEFRVILWPEFPQSRPATGLRWDDAWMALSGRLNGGAVAAARDYTGHHYTLVRIERTAPTMSYKNFKLHNGITIVAKDDEGQIQRFTFVRSVAERKGRFKIYSLKD